MIPGVSVMFHPDRPIGETADLAAEAERLGYEGVWVVGLAEHLPRRVRRADARRGAHIAHHDRHRRHEPAVATPRGDRGRDRVDRRARLGRPVVLGIGTGETAVEDLGRKRATIARMEETARVIRGSTQGSRDLRRGAAHAALARPARADRLRLERAALAARRRAHGGRGLPEARGRIPRCCATPWRTSRPAVRRRAGPSTASGSRR